MIGYRISLEELVEKIETEKPGWSRRAKERTEGFRSLGRYDESSSIWSEVKVVYLRLQGESKCAFCERKLEAESFGKGEQDVEHFRPKKRVRGWAPSQALVDAGVVVTEPPDDARGYHLLAYHPFNYTAACKPCNSALKGDRFPIAGDYDADGEDPRDLLSAEEPLLIYPLGDFDDDPEELIAFRGVSPHAEASSGQGRHRALVTIELFRLDDFARKNLFLDRARILVALYPQLESLDSGASEVIRSLVEAFTAASSPHTNCARSFRALYDADPEEARELFLEAAELIMSSS